LIACKILNIFYPWKHVALHIMVPLNCVLTVWSLHCYTLVQCSTLVLFDESILFPSVHGTCLESGWPSDQVMMGLAFLALLSICLVSLQLGYLAGRFLLRWLGYGYSVNRRFLCTSSSNKLLKNIIIPKQRNMLTALLTDSEYIHWQTTSHCAYIYTMLIISHVILLWWVHEDVTNKVHI